ncbi:hypothetical protein LCGC14_0699250 [marine sediment metagenome]|uniref:Right handed beta helix domain-containing protein n=1 Tax=marine sediment metagenome TaxID=412755 RepID=A0A0F9TR32_9ZZZZ
MKGKLGAMGRVALALVLALVLVLVPMDKPVLANVGESTVTLSSYLAEATDVEHTISFNLGASLPTGGSITIDFDDAYVSPATVADNDVTVDGAGLPSASVVITQGTDTWEITLPTAISTATNPVAVVITSAAGLDNPVATTYTLFVETSAEDTPVESADYEIVLLPTVTALKPDYGNVGDTMWVEVEGDGYTGDDTTNASTTTISFGSGITVVSTKFISAVEIDVQITITAPGAPNVLATSPVVGEGTVGDTFTSGVVGTGQVDVWNTYDITADPFVAGTLEFDSDGSNPFDTITAALVAADTDDTLIVHAATYNEQVAIASGRDRLTLIGNSATDTIIQAPSGIITTINVASESVTIRGFWIKAPLGSSQQAVISVGSGGQGTSSIPGVIEDNKLEGVDPGSAFANIVLLETTDYWDIKDNEFVDGRSSIAFNGADNILVSGNTISDGGVGSTENSADVTLSGNQFTDAGIGLATSASNFAIVYNTITGANSGIKIWGTGSIPTVYVRYNNISGNTNYGIEGSTGSATLDAKYNWWGASGGPGGGGLGTGDNVTGLVDYEPWLTTVQATAVSNGIAYHGSIYPLASGWNTLSVPLALDSNFDTLDEIVTLGDFIVLSGASQNYLGGYYFDAAGGLGWQPLTGTHQLKPGDAVYVKMGAAASFPMLYSGVFSLPTVSLSAGWNLIGSAFGIDKTTNIAAWAMSFPYGLGDVVVPTTPNGFRYVATADSGSSDSAEPTWLTTEGDTVTDSGITWTTVYGDVDYGIADTTDTDDGDKAVDAVLASLGDNASVVISPSMPGQTLAWATVASDNSIDMIVGEGYWVYMTAPATLAGLEVTPIYWINLP